MLFLVLSAFAAIAIGHRYRRMPPGPARQQVTWVAFGFCVSAVATVAYIRLINDQIYGNIPDFVGSRRRGAAPQVAAEAYITGRFLTVSSPTCPFGGRNRSWRPSYVTDRTVF